jgi:hypothetical protein
MSKPNKDFVGLPVEGHIREASTVTPQYTIEQLQPLIQAVLDDPTIVKFGWAQYTPYFNDGDVCEFGVTDPWFQTMDNEDVEDIDDGTWELGVGQNASLGKVPYTWDDNLRCYVNGEYMGPDRARYDRCDALSSAVGGGHYENVLKEAFGDHAQVTVTKTGITVEHYSHE